MYRPIVETFAKSDAEWLFPVESRALRTAELIERSTGAAALLAASGVTRGSFVGLSMENHSTFVIAALAAWRLGASLVPLRPLRGEVESFLDRVHALSPLSLLLYDANCDEPALAKTGIKTLRIDVLAELARADVPLVSPDPESPALVQYSSGSTGAPKGVIVTHRMVVEQVDEIGDSFRNGTGSPLRSIATWMPLYHDGGLFTGMMLPLLLGTRNTLATPRYYVANPARWFKLAVEREVDMVLSTNAAMVLGLRQLVKHTMDLRRCHLFLSAEKVSPEVLRETLAWLAACGAGGDHVHVPFGMAENTLSATCAYGATPLTGWFRIGDDGVVFPLESAAPGAVELVSCGPAYPGVSVGVCDESDRLLPELRLGEISIGGPCVMPGYINDPESSRVTLRGGRLHTNDLAFMHRGELWYVARKDDHIVVDGRNIVPDDVEHAAEGLDFMRPGSTALVAIDHGGGQQLHLLVEDGGRGGDRAERRRLLRERVLAALDLLVDHIDFVARGTVEKTSSGKKRRKVIRQRLAAGQVEIVPDES